MQLVVLGMHRSGTSLMAGLLSKLGAYYGPDVLSTGASHENPKGFWERRDIRNLNDWVLHSLGCDWNKLSNFNEGRLSEIDLNEFNVNAKAVVDELASHSPWVIKEPRLCLLMPLWKEVIENPVYIYIYRNPIEVALSLKERNGIPIYVGLALWEMYNICALNASKSMPRIFISYNEIMSKPLEKIEWLYQELVSIGVKGINAPDESLISEFIENKYYRQRSDKGLLDLNLNSSQLNLYQKLESAVSQHEQEAFRMSALSSMTLEEYEEQMMKDKEMVERLDEAQEMSVKAEEVISDYKKEINKLNNEVEKLNNEVEDSNIKLNEMKQYVSQMDKSVIELTDIYYRLDTMFHAVLVSRKWKFAEYLSRTIYRIMSKPVPNLVDSYISKIHSEYLSWNQKYEALNQSAVNKTKESPKHEGKFKKYIPLRDSMLEARIREYRSSEKKKKYVVYTAIFGNYDELKIPEVLNSEYDYVCFTDQIIPDHPVWKFRHATYFNSDPTRMARYYKLHPHFYLKEYEVAIWVDANILIRADIQYLVDEYLKQSNPLGIFSHYQRKCTYEEADACIQAGKDKAGIINDQIDKYSQLKLPAQIGLPETNVLISRPSDNQVANIYTLWWREIDNGSRRDQLSVMYALWLNKSQFTPLVNVTSKMARFDRNNFELFEHKDKTSKSHPSVYIIPEFVRQNYSNKKNWWLALKPEPVSKNDLLKYTEERVDVVIPVHNALDDVKKCLDSVDRTLLSSHRLIIVDDGSDTETMNYLKTFVEQRKSCASLIRHNEAGGYTKAANAGMRISDGRYVILLNSDTIVPSDWILKLVHCAESAPEIGIVGPLSNAASWQSVPKIKDADGSYSVNPLPNGITIDDVDNLCQDSSFSIFPRVQLVNGFCFCVKRSVIDSIGLLDEKSYPKGYGEENDYCFRATDAGFDLAIATHTYVYHSKSKSYTSKKRNELCKVSGKVFENAYGKQRISRATESVRLNPLINQVREIIANEMDKYK